MPNNIKGITIEIGGNTGPLTTALKDVNKTAGDLQSELKQVNRQLKFDPKNVDLLRQKEELTSQATQALKEKQEVLKQAVEQAHQQFEKGDLGADKVRAVEREYAKVSSQIKDLESQHKSFFSKVAEKLKITKENFKTAIGTVGMTAGAFLKDAVSSATGAQKSTSQLTNLLKNQGITAGQAKKDIDSFTSGITQMSSFSVGEAKEALQTLTEKGISAGDSLKMEGTLANIAAGQNISLGEAANTLTDAYHGKTKALISLGIVTKDEVTNSNKAQKAEELQGQIEQNIAEKYGKSATATKLLADMYNHKTDALVTAGVATKAEAKTLDDSSKSALTMTDIQDRLNKRFGGAAQADLNTYSGKMKEMQNTLNNAKAQIGTALLPILAQLAKIISDLLKPIANFISQHPKITAGILSIVAAIGTFIGGASVINTIAAALGPLGAAITGTEVAASSLIVPILAVTAAIAGIIALATLVITNWSGIKAFFVNLWNGIKATTESVWNSIKLFFINTWNGISNTAVSIWNNIGNFFKSLWNGIKTTTESIWNGIKTFFVTVWNGIVTGVMAIVNPFIKGILNIWNSIKNGITTVMNGVKNVLSGIWNTIKTVVLGIVLIICDLITGNWKKLHEDTKKIFDKLKSAFEQIWNGIKQIFTGTVQAITGFLTTEWNGIVNIATAVWNGLKQFFLGLWEGIKTGAVNGWNALRTGVVNVVDGTINWIKTAWENILNWFKNLPSNLYHIGVDIFNGLKNGINSVLSTLGGWIKTGFNDVVNFFKNLPSEALKWGADMINGFVSGIKNTFGAIGKAVNDVASSIRKVLHFSVPDEGPLKDYESWMPDFMKGLADGINRNKSIVANAIKGLATDVNVGMNANRIMTGNDSNQQNSNGKNDSHSRKVEQHINVQNMNVQSKGDEERTLQQLQFIAQI